MANELHEPPLDIADDFSLERSPISDVRALLHQAMLKGVHIGLIEVFDDWLESLSHIACTPQLTARGRELADLISECRMQFTSVDAMHECARTH